VFNPFLEFRMGIRFNTNTWRAPLLLIDSWLPARSPSLSGERASLPQVVQRFTRAGWLGQSAASVATDATASARISPPVAAQRACHVRVLRTVEAANDSRRKDTRLVISGRINDVCAELDRLAALEHPVTTAQA
jgi:hypothetical protein